MICDLYNDLWARLDSKKGENDFYRLAKLRNRDGKYVQQARVRWKRWQRWKCIDRCDECDGKMEETWKTEYVCVIEGDPCGTVRQKGSVIKKVDPGSIIQNKRECGKEVKEHVQASWNRIFSDLQTCSWSSLWSGWLLGLLQSHVWSVFFWHLQCLQPAPQQ